jgi:hypothetical protein
MHQAYINIRAKIALPFAKDMGVSAGVGETE